MTLVEAATGTDSLSSGNSRSERMFMAVPGGRGAGGQGRVGKKCEIKRGNIKRRAKNEEGRVEGKRIENEKQKKMGEKWKARKKMGKSENEREAERQVGQSSSKK